MKKVTAKSVLIYLSGLIILCLGVVLNTKTKLGVAAINSIPFALSRTTSLSLGTATFILYCVFIVVQCLIKRKVDILTVLQLPVSLLFGRMVDFVNTRVLPFEANSIVQGFIMLAVAIVLVAFGTTLVVSQNLVLNAPDGIVQTIANKINWNFGKCKVVFDLVCICVSAALSMILANHIIGIGIGTVCSMVFTGTLCSQFKKLIK